MQNSKMPDGSSALSATTDFSLVVCRYGPQRNCACDSIFKNMTTKQAHKILMMKRDGRKVSDKSTLAAIKHVFGRTAMWMAKAEKTLKK